MTREEQKEIRELNKQIPIELKKLKKELGIKFAYGIAYCFESDFLYSTIIDVNCAGVFQMSLFIKPWILNALYWEIQQFDMEEMLSQPESFHVRGAFTINDIYYQLRSLSYDKDSFSQSLYSALVEFKAAISEHKKQLTSIHSITQSIIGYKISNLTRAIALIYEKDYESALSLLLQENPVRDVYTHISADGRTATDYAIEYCKDRLEHKQF